MSPLMDDLVDEVLLRFPPADPASLVRAALVCKQWHRLVSDPGFRRRFREFHRKPPILGVIYGTLPPPNLNAVSTFVSTSSFRPTAERHNSVLVMDARHGRVLLQRTSPSWLGHPSQNVLVVWDPITNEQWELPLLPIPGDYIDWNATVLCAGSHTGTCNHLHCSRPHFLVVLVATPRSSNAVSVYSYSSDTGAWSKPTTAPRLKDDQDIDWYWQCNKLLVGNTLHVMFRGGKSMLEFNLGTRAISVVDLPVPPYHYAGYTTLMTTEAGGLGFANMDWKTFKLHLWARQPLATSPNNKNNGEKAGWIQTGAIDLKTPVHGDTWAFLRSRSNIIGFADGVNVLFIYLNDEICSFDLKSGHVATVCKDNRYKFYVFPYTSFYVPVLGAPAEGPR